MKIYRSSPGTGYLDTLYIKLNTDTKANILATTPENGQVAYATDVERFYVYDGSDWQESAVHFSVRSDKKNMGYEQDESGKGYGDDYITDKNLHNIALRGNNRTVVGALRIDVTQDPDTFEIYLSDDWQTILYDLTVENDEFEHTPLSETIDVWSGNSNLVGLSGLPIVQEYKVSMGAYPVPRTISGGTF